MVADVGGTSIDDAIRRMMKYIFSNELALEYNLFGRHGKKKFKDLRLFNVVYGKQIILSYIKLLLHTVILN